jgi:ABC-2 type transport system permease protein
MISFTSTWAVLLRHMCLWKRDLNYMLMALYWPLLDVITWGFLGLWIEKTNAAEFHNYKIIALLGVLLWQVIGRGCNYLCFTFNEELWSYNITNLFSLPLRITEWILGVILFSLLMIAITILTGVTAIYFLYGISFWHIIIPFFIFMPPLFFSSLWIGFTCLQVIVTFGRRGVELGFILAWSLMPFSGAYYPIHVLPLWAQTISSFLPMSYVFEGMRNYVMYQQDPTTNLLKGYALSIPYAIGAILLFVYCFNRSKRNGLARLTD